MTRATIADIRAHLADHLTTTRVRHVEGVRETALRFAEAHRLDLDLADRTALLHDVAKSMSKDELLDACGRYGISLTEDDLQLPGVLHAYVGAEIAGRDFDLDATGCQAIRAHTTGWVPMGPFDMVLYVADYYEPGRANADANELCELACVDLAEATIRAMTRKLFHLLERDAPIHPRGVTARNALLGQSRAHTD